jgi:hypothetical protein
MRVFYEKEFIIFKKKWKELYTASFLGFEILWILSMSSGIVLDVKPGRLSHGFHPFSSKWQTIGGTLFLLGVLFVAAAGYFLYHFKHVSSRKETRAYQCVGGLLVVVAFLDACFVVSVVGMLVSKGGIPDLNVHSAYFLGIGLGLLGLTAIFYFSFKVLSPSGRKIVTDDVNDTNLENDIGRSII